MLLREVPTGREWEGPKVQERLQEVLGAPLDGPPEQPPAELEEPADAVRLALDAKARAALPGRLE